MECWCGRSLSETVEKLADSACNIPCVGNGLEDKCQPCGGDSKINIYHNPNIRPVIIPDSVTTNQGDFYYGGCFSKVDILNVDNSYSDPNGVKIDICAGDCLSDGHRYSGTYGGTNCRCANGLPDDAPNYQVDDKFCNEPCEASTYNFCGGNGYIEVYQFSDPD